MAYERHPLEEIEGIGPARATALREYGVRTTEDLLRLQPEIVASRMRAVAGFSTSLLGKFRSHAELLQVTGLTGQHAEALYAGLRRNLLQLAGPTPNEIVAVIDAAVEQNLLPEGIDAETAGRWQKRALTIAYTGTVAGRVRSGTQPVANARVHCGLELAVTDADGEFWLPAVQYGHNPLVIEAEGHKRRRTSVQVSLGRIPHVEFELHAGSDPVVELDESKGQAIRSIEVDDRLVFDDIAIEDLPEHTLLHYRHTYRDGQVRLLGVHRRREGKDVHVPRVKASGDLITGAVAAGQVFEWTGGQLSRLDKTIREVHRETLAKAGIQLTQV